MYVIGGSGMCEELNNVGINTFGSVEDDNKDFNPQTQGEADLSLPNDVQGIMIAKDIHLNPFKLARANILRKRGIPMFFTGVHSVFVIEDMFPQDPNARQLLSQEPLMLAKPNPFGFKLIMNKTGMKASESLMVGDRFDSDINFGAGCNMHTFFVLSGETSRAEMDQAFENPDQVNPTYWGESIST